MPRKHLGKGYLAVWWDVTGETGIVLDGKVGRVLTPAMGQVGETLEASVEGIAGGGVLAGNRGCRDTDNKDTVEKAVKSEEELTEPANTPTQVPETKRRP